MSPISPAAAIGLLAIVVCLGTSVVWLFVVCRHLRSCFAEMCQRLSECMDMAPFCAYAKDVDGIYVYENRKLLQCMGKSLPHITSFLGRTDLDCFPADQAEQYMANDREVLRGRVPIAFMNTSTDIDGKVHHWSTVKFPWIDARGRDCVIGLSVDSTEIQRAQEDAKASEDRCRLALEAGRMGSMSLDLKTLVLDTSPVFASLHGRPGTTRLSLQDSLAQVHEDDRANIEQALNDAIQDRAPKRVVYRVVHSDGTTTWIELVGDVCRDETGRPAMVRAVGFDVTDRKASFDEIARHRDMLRRLIEVQENERQTLCHELHDGMMQYVIGAKMLLETARTEMPTAAACERIDAALDCLSRGVAEGRQVIGGVRSAVLDDLGLTAAIEDLGDQLAASGVTVAVNLDDDIDALDSAMKTTVYRIVQESLANVRKHAETDRAEVTIRLMHDEVRVHVRDAGKGFDVDEARRRGFGLVGMAERVRLAGGSFTIQSHPGPGTEVTACLPVLTAEDRADLDAASSGYAAATPGFLDR